MTLILGKNGKNATGFFRKKGMKPLHLSMRTAAKREAKRRHDAVQIAVRSASLEFIEQIREGVLSVERLADMIDKGEPLIPIVVPSADVAEVALGAAAVAMSAWDTVEQAGGRYLTWLRQHPNRAEQTKNLAAFQLAPFYEFVYEGQRLGDLPLDRVPSAAIQAYQSAMVTAKRSPNSITVLMGRVSTLWSWSIEQEQRIAREERRAARELFSPVVADLLHRKKRPRDRILTADEADAVFAATPRPLLWFVGCGLLAGLRAGETIHLRPGIDVDLDEGSITVREQDDWKPKTERSKRFVPMAPSLLEIARDHAANFANESWMMPSPVDGALPITDLGVRPHFKAVIERAGLVYGRDKKHGVTYHTLRHSFASHAVMRGVDLYTVAKLLGDSLKTVEDTYADLSPDFKRAAVAKLAGAFTLPQFSANDTTRVTEDENR